MAAARNIKVERSYAPRKRGEASVPKIRLEGKWLEQAGFPMNSRVAVEVSAGVLIIRVDAA